MEKITTVGLDLAKQVMAVHGVGAEGRTVVRALDQAEERIAACAEHISSMARASHHGD